MGIGKNTYLCKQKLRRRSYAKYKTPQITFKRNPKHPTTMANIKKAPAEQAIVSSVDAFWALYLSQKKTVRKAIAKRIIDLEASERRNYKKKADEVKTGCKGRKQARAIAESMDEGKLI